MKLVFRKDRIKNVAKRFEEVYRRKIRYSQMGRDIEYARLLALGDEPDVDKVNEILGVNAWSWNGLFCDECRKDVEVVARFGDGDPYDDGCDLPYMDICLSCLAEAKTAIEVAK